MVKRKGIYQRKHKHVWTDFDMGYDGSVVWKRCEICDEVRPPTGLLK